ncbi:MAG: hypothetical protein A3H79_02820 [Candidatus Levybacteria bacterium RIFCSPLOWO2_02_FULL_36_8b]|nr:MAG: hypothetical protein A3H79_02820 [Candidatus Levybacteria bacterium RIFCSPLOWO2_02_FULL_36_8b]
MPVSDLINVSQWWSIIFIIGIVFLPLTNLIFSSFFDKGYIFAKIIGTAAISYVIFVLGFLKILPFTEISIALVSLVFLIINIVLISKYPNLLIFLKRSWKIFFFEEILFLGILFFWSFIHAHAPDIHGLEKYMDFGFINSILRADYFPPQDMWLTPFPINYYYFGHLVTAVLTKLSLLPSAITFNLMLSTISAISFVSAFSISANLLKNFKFQISNIKLIIAGLLTAFILNFAGNLHTVYLFFTPYLNENPVPFWNLTFSPQTFPNSYWYPNATRFIHNTIHEFPIYSSVVSDLHGHFLDLPFVLLAIAVLLSLVLKLQITNHKSQINLNAQNSKHFGFGNLNLFGAWNFEFRILLLAFLLAIMYMTNAWDGLIYFALSFFIVSYIILRSNINLQGIQNSKFRIQNYISKFKITIPTLIINILVLGTGFIALTIPFNLNFKPFASGIGVLCAPKFLTDIGHFGPFIFEPNHCQRSPLWQLFILYGFFYFWVVSLIFFMFKLKSQNSNRKTTTQSSKYFGFIRNLKFEIRNSILPFDVFVVILILFSTLLIILPEFIYVKDIYPAHYRANTMFKLVYQSFVMLSLSSGYIIIRLFLNLKSLTINHYWKLGYWVIGLLGLLAVFLYPYFAIKSYFGDLKIYSGLNGTKYLKNLYPNDYEAILWINKNIKGQPVILEAQGDSYTDFARISTNTGLPTVLGWTVHEWLWRGTYDIPSPRIADVQKLYESNDIEETKNLLKKYKAEYVFIGDLEKQKYLKLDKEKFQSLGKTIYQNGQTKIYKIN